MLTQDLISKAVKIIERGGVVIHPTDTCYGLAANVFDKTAVAKIYKLKGRDFNKPVIFCVRDFAMAEKLVDFNSLAKLLFDKFLPGPLTLVLPSKINPGKKDSIRIPNHPVILALSRICSVPFTTTSANLSGGPNPYSISEIPDAIKNNVDLILDVGTLPKNLPSTVIEVTDEEFKILRGGPVSQAEIRRALSAL